MLTLLLSLTILSIFGLRHLDFNNNIENMLPAGVNIKRSISFLRESNISDKVILSISCKKEPFDRHEFIQAVDNLAKMLKKSDLVTDVLSTVSEASVMNEIRAFMTCVPQLIDCTQ